MDEITLTASGLTLAARVHGPSDAPPLLALHGWLDNAASFDALAAHLPQRRLIALDLPGHGRSDHLPAAAGLRYHFTDSVGIVLAALDALGLTQVDLLGHSMGAGIASLMAAAAPERVRCLTLIEGLGPLADAPATTLQRFRSALTRPGTARPLRVFAAMDAAVAARCRASNLAPHEARPIVERGLRAVPGGWQWRSDPRLTLPTAVRMAEAQVQRLLTGIQCPTWLLLATPATPYLPDATMAARAACVADIRIEHLAGHHHLHVQHPVVVATSLLRFLT